MGKVKHGYKQTDVGVIPEDWEVITYGEAFTFLKKASYSRAELTDNGQFGYIHYGDIHTKWIHFLDLNIHSLPSITEKQALNYSKIINGDLIVADASEDYDGVGKSIEVKNVGERNVISGLHTFLLRDKKDKFVDGFKGYIASNKQVKQQFEKLATGLKVYGISKENLKSILIPYPKEAKEQKAIATALSDIDSLIDELTKLIDKKRAIKEGAMQQLLSPKEGWEEKMLNQICWFQEGPGLRNWQFTTEGIKVINVTNLENGYLNLSRTDRYISLDEFKKMYRHFEIDENDIVIASSGNSYGKVSIVRKTDLPLLMNTSVIRFKPINKTDYNFLLMYLKSIFFKNQIDISITGGAQPNFGPYHLNKISLSVPKDKREQRIIGETLMSMETEISTLEENLSKYKAIKTGMMQQLLTGQIRLV